MIWATLAIYSLLIPCILGSLARFPIVRIKLLLYLAIAIALSWIIFCGYLVRLLRSKERRRPLSLTRALLIVLPVLPLPAVIGVVPLAAGFVFGGPYFAVFHAKFYSNRVIAYAEEFRKIHGHYPAAEQELPTFGLVPYLIAAGPKLCSLHDEEDGSKLFYKTYSPKADDFAIEFGWEFDDMVACYRYSSIERLWKCSGTLC